MERSAISLRREKVWDSTLGEEVDAYVLSFEEDNLTVDVIITEELKLNMIAAFQIEEDECG